MSTYPTSALLRLPELDSPLPELSSKGGPEGVLVRLRAQNDALANLRDALSDEEVWVFEDDRLFA